MGTEEFEEAEELPAGVIIEDEEESEEKEKDEEEAGRLGSMLIRDGKITPEQLESALSRQKQDWHNGQKSFLGQILVETKAIQQNDLICALMKQARLPYLPLLSYEIDSAVLKLVPEDVCRRHLLLPIDRLGKMLTVAMVSPMNEAAMAAVKKACPNLQIKRIICGWPDLQEVFRRQFCRHEPMQLDLKIKLAKH